MNKEEKTPTVLYHYTSFDALRNIVIGNKLWITNVEYLNDRKEYHYGKELVMERLSEKIQVYKESSHLKLLGTIAAYLRSSKPHETFTFSLTEEEDLLSQWRAYCQKGGVSIGFKTEALDKAADINNFRLLPCIYEKEKQLEMIDNVLEIFIERYESNKKELETNNILFDSVCKLSYWAFLGLLIRFKHSSFKEEKEWRLINGFRDGLDSDKDINRMVHSEKTYHDIKYRACDSYLKPYIEFDFDDIERKLPCIDRIIIGPNKNMYLALDSVESFKKSCSKDWVVEQSNSPYRIE